ncbi:MAG: sigma-54-dependent transcriptional regulator [Candidatus Binatia bacterium]
MQNPQNDESQMISILLVDDDATFSKVFSRELARMNFEVEYVSDGRKGLEALGQRPYDIVLLDIFMPEPDGLTVLESIQELHPGTTVIMLTGYGTIDSAIKSMKMGAFDYLTKPFRLAEVKISIEKAMEAKRLAESNKTLK